jgi:Uma2 family endonuclease
MVNRLTRLLAGVLSGRGILSVQNPVRLDDCSEPEPDVVVLRPRADDYATATPCPPDVLLLIEVADTSLDDDRAIKVPLYAENGIAECWIVNLLDRVVEVYRQPGDGRYADIRRVGPGAVLDFALLPGVALPVVDLFPAVA